MLTANSSALCLLAVVRLAVALCGAAGCFSISAEVRGSAVPNGNGRAAWKAPPSSFEGDDVVNGPAALGPTELDAAILAWSGMPQGITARFIHPDDLPVFTRVS